MKSWIYVIAVVYCIVLHQGVVECARGDEDEQQSQAQPGVGVNLPSNAGGGGSVTFQTLVNEAKDFFKNMLTVQNASASVNSKLSEFKQLVQDNKDRLQLPKGWDKNSLLDVLKNAVNQNSQFQDLQTKFTNFMADLQNFDKSVKEKSLQRLIANSPLLSAAMSNASSSNATTDNTTLAGKLAGLLSTGKGNGLSLSNLSLCSSSVCNSLSSGFQDLKKLFGNTDTTAIKNFFQNPSDSFKKLFGSLGGSGSSSSSGSGSGSGQSGSSSSNDGNSQSGGVDYFDYYYNNNNNQNNNQQTGNRGKEVTGQPGNGRGKGNHTDGEQGQKAVDYFDLYYHTNIEKSRNKTG